jgi:hypothetical protein
MQVLVFSEGFTGTEKHVHLIVYDIQHQRCGWKIIIIINSKYGFTMLIEKVYNSLA